MNTHRARPGAEEMTSFLDETLNRAIEHAGMFRINKGQHRLVAALYGSILELSKSVLAIEKADLWTGATVLARSMLEAFADLRNAIDSKEYLEFVEARNLAYWLDLFEAAKAGNAFAADLTKVKGFEEIYLERTEKLKALAKRNIAPLGVKSRFKRAGLVPEYDGLYPQLSSEGAHRS